jgi:hypothetical protein
MHPQQLHAGRICGHEEVEVRKLDIAHDPHGGSPERGDDKRDRQLVVDDQDRATGLPYGRSHGSGVLARVWRSRNNDGLKVQPSHERGPGLTRP